MRPKMFGAGAATILALALTATAGAAAATGPLQHFTIMATTANTHQVSSSVVASGIVVNGRGTATPHW